MAPKGRPSSYSETLADEICARLAEGRSMISVCGDDDMPSQSMVFRWLAQHEDFREKYRACADIRADAFAELLIENALTANEGEVVTTKETKDGIFTENRRADNVPRSDLIARSLQWALARMAPKKYGDKLSLESKVDITKHYNDDDVSALDRLVEQKIAERSRKPSPAKE